MGSDKYGKSIRLWINFTLAIFGEKLSGPVLKEENVSPSLNVKTLLTENET